MTVAEVTPEVAACIAIDAPKANVWPLVGAMSDTLNGAALARLAEKLSIWK